MSQLLDALRKTDRAGGVLGPSRSSRPESLLTSMGYRAPQSGRRWPKVIAGLLALVALSAFSWVLNPSRLPGSTRAAAPAGIPRTETRAGSAAPLEPVAASPAGELLQSPAPSAPAPPSRSPLDDFRRAVRYQEAGDLNRAVEIYQSLLARDALPAEVHNNLGLIHQARGNLDEAAREFQHALMHDPGYAKAHNNFGVLLLARHRTGAAISSFRAASRANPSDIASVINLALAQKAAGLPEQAAETLLYALGVSPRSAPAHYNLAVLYDGSGERARAVEHYRAFLEHRGSAYSSLAADVQARLAELDGGR